MARADDLGRVFEVRGGKVRKVALANPEVRGGHWVTLRDAQRIFDRTRVSIETAIRRGFIRAYRKKARGPYPSLFVLYEDVEVWSRLTPRHRRRRSYLDEPIYGVVKDPESIRSGND